MQSPFLSAEWRKLAMANYSIDPAILKPYIPFKTELDLLEGKCYVSLIGFRFINTKLKGIPVPFHKDFEEINLRFYVKYKEGGTWKRGVTFIKEIVPKAALTLVANTIYKEKYVTLPTRYNWSGDENSLRISYEWKHKGSWDKISFTAANTPFDIAPGSMEEFITEHYWGFTKLNDKKTSQYQVEHPRWQVYPVNDVQINVRFEELYGPAFRSLNNTPPDSVLLAEGSTVMVRMATKIE